MIRPLLPSCFVSGSIVATLAAQEAPPRFPGSEFSIAAEASALAVGDFDEDAILDVVVGYADNTNAEILLGRPGGRFERVGTIVLDQLTDLATGDVDLDGHLDVVATRLQDGVNPTLFVARGTGTGTFSTPSGLPIVLGNPLRVRLGDFDGDQALDYAIQRSGLSALTIAFGNGLGGVSGITNLVTMPNLSEILWFELADLNRDGDLDLVITTRGGMGTPSRLLTRLGNGLGAFAAPFTLDLVGDANTLALGDIDGDADLDVLLPVDSNVFSEPLRTYENDGSGHFVARSGIGIPIPSQTVKRFVALADTDGDPHLDAIMQEVWTSQDPDGRRVYTARGLGAFAFTPFRTDHCAGGLRRAIDADRDGVADGIYDRMGFLGVQRGEGNGGFVSFEPSTPISPQFNGVVGAGDLDEDGRADLAGHYGSGLVLLRSAGAPTGYSVTTVPLAGNIPSTRIEFADLNGDQNLDIVKANTTTNVLMLIGNGTGAIVNAKQTITPSQVNDLDLADLDLDGDLDLAVDSAGGTTYRNDGLANFSLLQTNLSGANASALALGDLDGSGTPDVALTYATGSVQANEVRTYLNTGSGSVALAVTTPTPFAPHAGIELGDLDGNGNLDFLTAFDNSGLFRGLGNGSGGFGSLHLFPTFESSVSSLRLRDLDANGTLDAWMLFQGDDQLGISYGAGDGSFLPLERFYRENPVGPGVGDLDGDGSLDLAFSSTNRVIALLNRGSSGNTLSYGSGCPGNGGFAPQLAVTGIPTAGGAITLSVTHGLGGATALVFLGAAPANLPMGFGCSLLVAPLFPGVSLALPLAGSLPGTGSIVLPALLPPGTSHYSFAMQAFLADPAVAAGFSNSNGVRLVVD